MKTLLTAILLSSTLLAQAPPPVPGSPGLQLIESFVNAYNAADAPALERFASQHLSANALAEEPAPAFARRLVQRRHMTGPVQVLGVEFQQGDRAAYGLEAQAHRRYRLSVGFAPGAQMIEELGIDPELSAPRKTPATQTISGVAAAVDAYMTQLAQDGEFSGAVLFARGGTTVLRGARGLADREHNAPNTAQTRFNIASIGKIFTQVAIAQLIAAGKMTPGDTLGKWLPDYPSADAREHVTIAQLLSMRSGIGDFFGPEFMSGPHAAIRRLQDYLPYFASKPLAFRPGTSEQYSNGGYIVLGLIVEAASHQSYYEYVRRHIFVPAGMTHTGYPAIGEQFGERAVPYSLLGGTAPQNATAGEPGRGSSAGGAFSTVDDLSAFARALFAGKLVSLNALAQLGMPTVQATRIGILGGAPGTNAALLANAQGDTVVVLANVDPPAAEGLARQIRTWGDEIHL